MLLSLEILALSNALLLLLAAVAGFVILRMSVKYQRSVGESAEQRRQTRIIISALLVIIVIGLIAAGMNLFGG